MDFELSDDQRALQEAARDLLDGYASPAHVRAHLATGAGHDGSLWRAMIDQGWLAILTSEGDGGLGLGWVEVAVLLEEIGRHTAPAPFLPTLLALDALSRGRRGALRDLGGWIDGLTSGALIGCVAWAPSATVSGGMLTSGDGRLGPVVAGPIADVAVVATRESVVVIDLAANNGSRRPHAQPAVDQTRALGWLELDDTPVIEIGGAVEADALLDRGAVGTSAELLGGAARVLGMSAEYAKDRVQFGQPIGSFQAVKHRCADMVVDVEGMRSTAWYGAWCLDVAGSASDATLDDDERALGDEAAIAASTAKIWCADAARRVMASGLQVHGGIGFTWEHDLHLYLKRSQLDQLTFGDASAHRDRLGALLRTRVQAGQSVI